jgi:hypothetical protein
MEVNMDAMQGKGEGIPGSPSRAASGGYHLGRFGSSILQKAVGLVSFTSHTPKVKAIFCLENSLLLVCFCLP